MFVYQIIQTQQTLVPYTNLGLFNLKLLNFLLYLPTSTLNELICDVTRQHRLLMITEFLIL
jgi:hypothetical protein